MTWSREELLPIVQKRMNELGYNQSTLAESAGIGRHTVKDWINGKIIMPRADRVKAILDVLGIDGISEHETGGLQSPKAVSFQGAPPMPLPDPYTAARAGALAYAICQDIERAEKIGAKAAQSAMLSDGKITEHLIKHYIEMEGE